MSDNDGSLYVTRREFYVALVVVWIYIMLLFGNLREVEQGWTTVLLWAVSFFMVIAYAVLSLLAGRASRDGDKSA